MRSRLLFLLLGLALPAAAQTLQIDGSLPYAFHRWDTTGYSIDVGGFFANHHFLGLDYTAFSPKPTNYFPGLGQVQTSQKVQALDLAYHYSILLSHSLEWYLGAGAGLGRVTESLAYSAPAVAAFGGSLSASNTELSAELLTGLQYNFTDHFGIKVGFRYIDSFNNVRQFNADTNTDTKTIEAGVVFRL